MGREGGAVAAAGRELEEAAFRLTQHDTEAYVEKVVCLCWKGVLASGLLRKSVFCVVLYATCVCVCVCVQTDTQRCTHAHL